MCKNHPLTSQVSGLWERRIWSAGNIILSLIKTCSLSLSKESQGPIFWEVKGNTNSRRLIAGTTKIFNIEVVLSPSGMMSMPGVFARPDLFCKQNWSMVEHIRIDFWRRWKTDFLASLQRKQEWTATGRNLCVKTLWDLIFFKSL